MNVPLRLWNYWMSVRPNEYPFVVMVMINLYSAFSILHIQIRFTWNRSQWNEACLQHQELLHGLLFTNSVWVLLRPNVFSSFWLALRSPIYSQIALFFAQNRSFSLANDKRNTETKQPVKFQRLFKVTNEICRKMKGKESPRVKFATFVPKSLLYLFIENENRCN